jgi:hypothetical protein
MVGTEDVLFVLATDILQTQTQTQITALHAG